MPEFNKGRGKKLKLALFMLDITQAQCGRDLGYVRQYINDVLNDVKRSAPVVEAVAEYVIEKATEQNRQDVIAIIDWVEAEAA